MELTQNANFARYEAGQKSGHYESFFLRANHPTRRLAFWIRYTIFNPDKEPEKAIGERWAVYFDGETGKKVAAKNEVRLNTKIASSRLTVKRKKENGEKSVEVLETASRAAFEILTDDRDHGVNIVA